MSTTCSCDKLLTAYDVETRFSYNNGFKCLNVKLQQRDDNSKIYVAKLYHGLEVDNKKSIDDSETVISTPLFSLAMIKEFIDKSARQHQGRYYFEMKNDLVQKSSGLFYYMMFYYNLEGYPNFNIDDDKILHIEMFFTLE